MHEKKIITLGGEMMVIDVLYFFTSGNLRELKEGKEKQPKSKKSPKLIKYIHYLTIRGCLFDPTYPRFNEALNDFEVLK